jgi:4'-phosphopantetheinyl transferase
MATDDRLSPMRLMPGEIHLWQLDLYADAPQQDHYRSLLDGTERERAGRFATDVLRRRAVVAQGALRSILARYLDQPPETIRFERGPHGKPYLAGSPPDRGLVFNVTHSGDRAVFAIGTDLALGVDLELWRPLQHAEALAERCLARAERNYWQALPETDRCRVFFDFWTAKEAFAKAVGRGLGIGLSRCELSLGDADRLVAIPDDCGKPEEWALWRLRPGDGASSALCARTPQAQLRLLDFRHADLQDLARLSRTSSPEPP